MTDKKLPATLDPVKVVVKMDVFNAKIAELDKKFDWSPEKLDAMLAHVDEQAVVKGAKKTCTELRTKIEAVHKEEKAPYLEVGRALDSAKKKALSAVAPIEKRIDDAIARRKKADEEAAKKAQAEKEESLASENARLRAQLEAAGLVEEAKAEFEHKNLVLTIATAAQVKNLKALIGAKAFKDMQFDKQGQPYVLKVTVTRDSYDEDC